MIETIMRLMLATLCVTLAACFGGPAPNPYGNSTLKDFVGEWQGVQTSALNAMIVKISFDVHQKDGEVRGKYTCAPGNSNCYNNITWGDIRGKITNPSFHLELPDMAWCQYYGDFSQDTAGGGYTCYSNGMMYDNGRWKLRRVD